MPREVPLNTLLYVPLLFCTLNVRCVSSISDHCSQLVEFDVDEIENHLSKLNLTDVPTVKMMTAGFKCPISALPFGALKSDWSRLLLLREAQPDGSIIKSKLVRLMRILIVAYFQMEERFDDVTSSDTEIPKKSLRGTLTNVETVSNAGDENKLYSSDIDYLPTTETSNYDVDSSSTSADRNDNMEIKLRSTAEIVATKNSSKETTIVPYFDVTYENVTLSTGINVTTPYSNGAFDTKETSSRVIAIDNCLKQSFKDIMRKRPKDRKRGKIFETSKNKGKHTERAAQNGDKISYRKNRTRITPPPNEFWQHVTLPARANVSVSEQTYQTRGLTGFRGNDQKSRASTREFEKLYESYGRFLWR